MLQSDLRTPPTCRHAGQLSAPQKEHIADKAFLARWLRALKNMGGGISSFDAATIQRGELLVNGIRYPKVQLVNPHRNQRHSLMQLRQPARLPINHGLTYPIDEHCPLCREMGRGLLQGTKKKKLPIICAISEEMLIIPNLYPAIKGHSLALNRAHDDLSERIFEQTSQSAADLFLTPSKTRARLLQPKEVVSLFLFSRNGKYYASRNHPRNGMSVSPHDHWHLLPCDPRLTAYFAELSPHLFSYNSPRAYRIRNSPIDLAVLSNEPTLEQLAIKTALIFNHLERQHLVTTIFFSPFGRGSVIFSVLDPRCEHSTRATLGGSAFFNSLELSQCFGGPACPAPQNTVDWNSLTSGLLPVPHP